MIENHKDHQLTELLGLDCFKLSLFNEINKSVEILRDDFYTSKGSAYELRNRYYDFYVPNCNRYSWNLKEKIKVDSASLTKEKESFLSKIPFLEYRDTLISVKYNDKWQKILQTQSNLIFI